MPMPDDDEVALNTAAARGDDCFHPLVSFELDSLLVAQKLDAVLLVDRGERTADLLSHDSLERHPPAEDRRHPDLELRQRGGHLAADEAHADNDRAAMLGASRLIASHSATVRS